MSWVSLAPLLKGTLQRHRIAPGVGTSTLIEQFNSQAAKAFIDPGNDAVRAVSYRNRELTVFCKSPAYAAAVRERRANILDPLRAANKKFPIDSIRFVFKRESAL